MKYVWKSVIELATHVLPDNQVVDLTKIRMGSDDAVNINDVDAEYIVSHITEHFKAACKQNKLDQGDIFNISKSGDIRLGKTGIVLLKMASK